MVLCILRSLYLLPIVDPMYTVPKLRLRRPLQRFETFERQHSKQGCCCHLAAHSLPRQCRPRTVWNAYLQYAFQCGTCHVLRELVRRLSPTGNTETFLYRGKRGETPKLTGSSCHCLRPVGSKRHFRGSTATLRTNVSVVPFFCCDRHRLAKVREETAFALQR